MTPTLHEAWFAERQPDGRMRCTLCPHDCRIADGSRGACAVRFNEHGVLYAFAYDRVEGNEDTICPACRTVLVERCGFAVRENRIKDGGCPACGTRIAGVDMDGGTVLREP